MSNPSTNNGNNNSQPQQNQKQILSEFESLMDALVRATDATMRSSAEEKLCQLKNSNFLLYLECLLQLTLNSSCRDIKQLCVVMFRQSCQPNNSSREQWNKIPPSAYNVFQNGLLSAMSQMNKQNDLKTYLLICDAIGTLASRIIPAGYWKNLFTQLLELVNQANTYHKQGFLRVLDCLAEYCIEFLKPNFSNICGVIQMAIKDEKNINVVLQAYKSFVSIVVSIDNLKELNQWKDLIPICIDLLNIQKRNNFNEEILRQILSSSIDLVSHRFVLIKPVLDQLLIYVVQIARNDNFQFDTRKLAFEMLVVMTNSNAVLLRQHKQYMSSVVELSMYYLSLYDDNIDFNIIQDDIDQSYVWNARNWTSELALKLGGKSYLNIATNMMSSGLESTNWKQCYSVLQTFIQIIKYIKAIDGWIISENNDEQNKNNNWDMLLPKIIHLIISKSSRPQIKHSALFLIKTLIINYEASFCDRYYSTFYNSMIEILCNYKQIHFRVLIQCVKCISFFNKYSDIEQFKDKSDIILKQLLAIVSDDQNITNHKLKGHSVTCIGQCSYVMRGEFFLPYYDKFMPICMNLISNEKLQAILRGKAMECIGMIGESVGNIRFNCDAHKLMNMLLSYHKELIQNKNQNETNTIVYNYMNQLFARISRCIGDSFVQYFEFIIPSILQSASIEAAQILLPNEPSNPSNGGSIFTIHLRGIGDTKFCINPISLDEKDTACHMLYQFCKDQCVGFFPFILQTANVMKSLMRYQYNARVRAAATTIIPLLLKSVILNKNKIEEKKNEYLNLLNQLFEPFMEALISEPDVCETIPILEVLAQIASIIGHKENKIWMFSDENLLSISGVLSSLLSESQERMRVRINDECGNKLIVDCEKKEEIEWANDCEIELTAHIIDVCEYTFKACGEKFTKYFISEPNGLGQATKLILTKDAKYLCSDAEILQSICIFIDCIQFGGKLAADKYMHWFYPLCQQYVNDNTANSDADIKQTCIFAIGIFAKCKYLSILDKNSKYFHTFLNDIQQFKQNEEKEKENEEKEDIDIISKYLIYENMISTVGKILRYEPPANCNILQFLSNWIRLLPIENDAEEFNAITENLLYFSNKYWQQLIVNNQEIRSRILFSLLFYLAQFKETTNITSYEIIMDYNYDMTDGMPTNIPVLNEENIANIKQLKQNEFLMKIKAFEKVIDKLQPQEIQNIQFVVNKY